jgi:hypothetical protein
MYDDEQDYYFRESLRELRFQWDDWGTLERAASVVSLRKQGCSLRMLAWVACCSEGTIRNYEILGRTPNHWKQAHIEGRYSMRQLVQFARDEKMKRVPDDDDE